MILQKMPHYVDSILTQEDASAALQDGQVVVGLYTNRENVQSVVHSHPYYEMILPVAGSSVRYSVDGSVYDLHLGELILFPGEMYHSGKFNITDTTSERLVVQIAPGIWERAWAQSGLPRHVWSGDPVILDTDAVTQWDFRGLLERMAQTVYLDEKIRDTVQCCEVTELILLISQVVTRRHNAPPPSATSLLVAKAVAYLQANYTDPHLTVAQLAKYTYTSREHLSRVFKEYTLESIHGYLTNLRMQHCRNELADGTGVLDACTASGALAAISRAMARAASISSASGTTALARPHSRLSWALRVRPVKISSAALAQPIMRGKNQVLQASGTTPMRPKTKPMRALSLARRTSSSCLNASQSVATSYSRGSITSSSRIG